MTDSFIKQPRELMNWSRFDLPYKYLYAVARVRGLETDYFEEMYKHHLQVWNNFSEYNNPEKQGYASFKNAFDQLIDTIGDSGFDQNQSLVPVNDSEYLLNGAHRVAACLANEREVSCYKGLDGTDGQLDCSWQFFQQHRRFGVMAAEFADRAALELTKFRPDSRIVTLYPAAANFGNIDRVRQLLAEYGLFVYEKAVPLSSLGGLNLMRELYYKEEWAEKNNGAGYGVKAGFCYKKKRLWSRMLPTYVFIVEFPDQDTAVIVKKQIRAIYDLDKHSVHINDNHAESIRLAKCLLNDNSIHFLNAFNGKFFPTFEGLLRELQERIAISELALEDYCISAGSVLTAYGLKECKDLDYLHSGDAELPGNELIQSHNLYGVGRYHVHRDDIIHNPRNHFFRYGVKYSTLEIVKLLKERRGEPKDFKDIKLINKVL